MIIVTSDQKLQLPVGHCNELELAMMSLALLFDSIHYLNTVIANVVNNIKLPELQVTTWTENLLLLLPATWNLFLLNLRFISTLIKWYLLNQFRFYFCSKKIVQKFINLVRLRYTMRLRIWMRIRLIVTLLFFCFWFYLVGSSLSYTALSVCLCLVLSWCCKVWDINIGLRMNL